MLYVLLLAGVYVVYIPISCWFILPSTPHTLQTREGFAVAAVSIMNEVHFFALHCMSSYVRTDTVCAEEINGERSVA